jgi:hypothetical protein
LIGCCAPDAPVVVQVVGGSVEPTVDGWVRVTGSFEAGAAPSHAWSPSPVTPIPLPNEPYE